MSKAICLVSGGLDSCVAAAEAAAAGHELYFLHASYGQRTEERERQAFRELCRHFNVSGRMEINFSWLAQSGASALTDSSIPLPPGDLNRKEIPISYVPFRNANLLVAAISWAESMGAGDVYIGAVEEDSSGYPDCREEFFGAMQQAADLGTRPETQIRIQVPLLHLRKKEIVGRGLALEAPMHLTWSCYQLTDQACGVCDSCLLRLKAFEEAGVRDPLPYRTSGAGATK